LTENLQILKNSLTPSIEVAVAIGLRPCQSGGCGDPADSLGIVLYNGGFDPQYRVQGKPPHQNFTITIPSTATKGKAVLGLVHLALNGVSPKISQLLSIGLAYDSTFILLGIHNPFIRDSQCYTEYCLKATL